MEETAIEFGVLIEYAKANRGVGARLNSYVGYLTVQTTTQPWGARTDRVCVRDSRKRNQYSALSAGNMDRLEIKVGNRYRPFREVI